jgi:FixJ family two-component response regulator
VSTVPTVHVVDDDAPFRDSMARLLRAMGYVVETYASGDEFLHGGPPSPGCVLLDMRLPGPSGLDLQKALASRGGTLPVVFLTGHGDIPSSVEAMKAGAEDFLTKPVQPAALRGAIERALARESTMRVGRQRADALRARFDTLTGAERRIFAMVARGMLNKQIAYDLDRAERTVKAHRSQVMRKMQADSVAELVRMADALGLDGEGGLATRS